MTKTISYTLVILIILTITTALVSNFIDLKIGVYFILLLAVLKFIYVAFQFMEIKKAHVFWKVSLTIYLLLFSIIISLIL